MLKTDVEVVENGKQRERTLVERGCFVRKERRRERGRAAVVL